MAEPTTTPATGDFEVAKTVCDTWKDLPRDRQERVLRWVVELLGSANPATPKPHISTAR